MRKTISRILFSLVLIFALPMGASGCSRFPGGVHCTMVGCDSAVFFNLPAETYAVTQPVSIRLCVDGSCSVTDYQAGNQIPPMLMKEAPQKDQTTVSAEVRTSDEVFARLPDDKVKLGKAQPNGPRCGPTCYQARVRVPLVDD